MRAVVQRSRGASVTVGGEHIGGFEGPGLVVLVGVTHNDTADEARRLAAKVFQMRLFDADALTGSDYCIPPGGPRDVSASDLGLPLLVISQFTLYGRTRKGRRPTWEDAAPRPTAEPLLEQLVEHLRGLGAQVTTGRFGAEMRVTLVNDGPVTVIVEV